MPRFGVDVVVLRQRRLTRLLGGGKIGDALHVAALEADGVVMGERGLMRSRWAAFGAAVAVTLGGGGVFLAQAAPGPGESTIVSVTPTRVLDTRDPVDLGLAGPFVSATSQKLQVAGPVATNAGIATVVPFGATGVLLNVTVVGPSAAGFLSVRPGDASGAPSTSSLNFEAGVILPNSVQVSLPTAGANVGQIDITYDAYGTSGPRTDVLIDVVGYTTNQGIQSLVADLASKASNADLSAGLATKVAKGPIVMKQGPGGWQNYSDGPVATLANGDPFGTRFSADGGLVTLSIIGPSITGGEAQTLTSLSYCVTALSGGARVDLALLSGFRSTFSQQFRQDNTDRTAVGCYTVTPTAIMQQQSESFFLVLSGAGGGNVSVSTVTTTWGPRPSAALAVEPPSGPAINESIPDG